LAWPESWPAFQSVRGPYGFELATPYLAVFNARLAILNSLRFASWKPESDFGHDARQILLNNLTKLSIEGKPSR
jgi:hypothetical protein